jgi:cold shock CspA family protein
VRAVPQGQRAKLAGVAQGVVSFWHGEEGWGAVEVPGRDGIGFVHYKNVAGRGYRHLVPGERVEVEWADDRGQDGCQWRASFVRPIDRPVEDR